MNSEYFRHLIADAQRVEVRIKTVDRWRSKSYTDPDALQRAVERLDAAGSTAYTTLNRPYPDLPVTHAYRDRDIRSIVRLPFDFDPIRPKGKNSSASELLSLIHI